MANKTITFDKPLNTSLQATDIIYYLDPNNIRQRLGKCISVAANRLSFVVEVDNTAKPPQDDAYFMFNKNNVINSNGLIGYHATVAIKNTSTEFCELYAVNSEVSFSS